MSQGVIIDIPAVGCLEHMRERFVAGKRCGKGSRKQLISAVVRMVVQRNHDTLADDHIIPAIGFVIEDQLPADIAVQPAVNAL